MTRKEHLEKIVEVFTELKKAGLTEKQITEILKIENKRRK